MFAPAELVGDGVEVDIMSRAVGDCIIVSRPQYYNVAQCLTATRDHQGSASVYNSSPRKEGCKRALPRKSQIEKAGVR